MSNKKYLTGRFEITDNKGAFSVAAYVEVAIAIKSLFYVSINSFNSNGISMAFSSIELRALANHLKQAKYDKTISYSKTSGGSGPLKRLFVELIGDYYKIQIVQKEQKREIHVTTNEIEALGEEIEQIIRECMSNCYKTQQFEERKRLKNKLLDSYT